MITLNTIKPQVGSTHKQKRIGRGAGSGRGGHTSTRGMKGQTSRSGSSIPAGFEGGQMPLYRRLPKSGFKSPNRKVSAILNVNELEKLDLSLFSEISPEKLKDAGMIRKYTERLVILGTGDLSKKFTVKAHRFSPLAKEKIEKAGGTVELISVYIPKGKKTKFDHSEKQTRKSKLRDKRLGKR